MPSCTFFGHRDCPDSICPKLRSVLINLIENQQIDTFYVGRQGSFDALVYATLCELAAEYPHIRYAVVLERLSGKAQMILLRRCFPRRWKMSRPALPSTAETIG